MPCLAVFLASHLARAGEELNGGTLPIMPGDWMSGFVPQRVLNFCWRLLTDQPWRGPEIYLTLAD